MATDGASGRFALLLLAAWCGACGSRDPRPGNPWLGDTHAHGQEAANVGDSGRTPTGDRELSADEARDQLRTAMSAGQHERIIRHAHAVERAGGALSVAEADAVRTSVDALPGHLVQPLGDAIATAGDTSTGRAVALRLALFAEHIGDHESARLWLQRAGPRPSSTASTAAELDRRLADVRQRLQAREVVDGQAVGVLLPLTGRHSRLGLEMQQAIQFALRADKDRPRLHFLDTLGTTEGARAAVDRAVFEHNAIALIGPVGERETEAAARRAARLGVPIALLSPGDGDSAPGGGVFRLWSSPRWEAREAARLAIGLGYDRLAVLAPRDEHGQQASRDFIAAARELGVEVVRTGEYDPSSNELERDVKAFLGLDPRTNARLRRHLRRRGRKRGWTTFSPDVDFDLLYVPDEYQRAALVVSFLPYFNVEVRSRDAMDIAYLKRKHRGRVPQVVQLLGSSGWHHPSLIPRGGPAVEGALVVDIYAGGEVEEFSSEEAARFAEAYDAWAGRLPGALTAQTYDAARLVLQARASAAATGRQGPALRQAMSRALGTATLNAGACGPARVTSRGGIDRRASLLRVDGGTFVLHEY